MVGSREDRKATILEFLQEVVEENEKIRSGGSNITSVYAAVDVVAFEKWGIDFAMMIARGEYK